MPQSTRSVHLLALTLILWVLGGTAFPPPDGVPSTYAAGVALFGGVLWVTFLAWRNGMATESVANLLHRIETEPARGRKVVTRAEGVTHGRTR